MEVESPGYSLVLHRDADAKTGGVAICGFSAVGMVGVIAASHIIKELNLEQLGSVLNIDLPAVALIHDEVPKHPVRVYQGDGVGVFTAELQFAKSLDVKFANTVLEWFTRGGFDNLIIIDGLTRQDQDLAEGGLYAVGASRRSRERLKTKGIEPVKHGVIAGIAGYLLSEGDRRDLDITALLAECNPMFPDARAAAIAIEALSELSNLDIPLSGLLADARKIEESVTGVFANTQTMLPAPEDDRPDPMIG